MANEIHPFGTVLAYSDDDSSYTSLTLVRLIKPPNISRGSMETTSLDSTEAWREYLQGWKDAGMMRFELHLAKALANTLLGTGEAFFGATPGDSNKYWRVTYPLISTESTGSRIKCLGHLCEFDLSELRAATDEPAIVAGAIKLSGKPTWTSGS